MDSMISGGAALTTIQWMFILNVLPRPDLLLSRTKNEWVKLKQNIDSGRPWPICLIGTTSSPFDNHQVLAYGYTDNGNGTGTIFMYDNNQPDVEATINLDFRGSQLQATESKKSTKRGPLKGFFCTSYQFNSPPEVVGLINALAPSSGKPGQTVSLNGFSAHLALNISELPTVCGIRCHTHPASLAASGSSVAAGSTPC
jgi:hypothetical protein